MFSVIGYDKNANECSAEDVTSIAKKSIDAVLNSEKFWIKICNNGINSGKFFDPLSNLEEELKNYESHTGRYRYAYKSVSRECFDLYLSFLKTKNSAFLKNAERRI